MEDEVLSEAGCRANIQFFRAECRKYTRLALQARAEEVRHEYMLLMLTDPEAALKQLEENEPADADPGYN